MNFFKPLKRSFYFFQKCKFHSEILNSDINKKDRMQEKPYDLAFHLENFLIAIHDKRVNPAEIKIIIEILVTEIKIPTCDLEKILNLLTKESIKQQGLEPSIKLLEKSVTETEKNDNIIPTR